MGVFNPCMIYVRFLSFLVLVVALNSACARIPHSSFVSHRAQFSEEPCTANQGCDQPGMLCGFPQLGREKQSAVLESIKADLNLPEDQLLMIGK